MTTSTDKNNQNAATPAAPVLFDTEQTDCGHLIGIMTLNTPKSLNALSVEMCQLLAAQLEQWERDEQVVALVLKGAGDKAFCAGGDIKNLHDDGLNPDTRHKTHEFFSEEYQLNQWLRYLFHLYKTF